MSGDYFAEYSPIGTIDQRRHYNRRKTVKVPPSKPLSFDYSGKFMHNFIIITCLSNTMHVSWMLISIDAYIYILLLEEYYFLIIHFI